MWRATPAPPHHSLHVLRLQLVEAVHHFAVTRPTGLPPSRGAAFASSKVRAAGGHGPLPRVLRPPLPIRVAPPRGAPRRR